MSSLLAHVDVSDNTLRLALTYVLEQAGHRRSRSDADADVTVTDRLGLRRAAAIVDALVVDPHPADCQEALDAVLRGEVRTVITTDDPEALPGALDAARRMQVVLPGRVVDEANRLPRLDRRLATTLHLVVSGCTNQGIARQLRASESTVKRDVAVLMRTFDCPNRASLASIARLAGYANA